MVVGIFYSSISNIHRAAHKQQLMDCFKRGVTSHGDKVVDFIYRNQPIEKLDAGFVLGYTLENNYRKKIIDTLKILRAKIIFVDSNIFSYGNQQHHYHRYSVGSVYPTSGEYFLGGSNNKNKLKKILHFHKIQLKPWRTSGRHILVLGQRTMSWNMLNGNGLDWIIEQVYRIKKHTDRQIIIRLHPGDQTYDLENRKKLESIFYGTNVSVSNNPHILQDLENAWCSVGYNSTPNCVSAIEGIPVYLDDPLNSWAKDVAFTDLNLIENPYMPDREEWLNKIVSIHWNNDEIFNGEYWKKFKIFYNC